MGDGIEEILVCDGLQVAFAVMLYHLQDQQFAAVLEELFRLHRIPEPEPYTDGPHSPWYRLLQTDALRRHHPQGEDIGAVIHSIVHFCTPETII